MEIMKSFITSSYTKQDTNSQVKEGPMAESSFTSAVEAQESMNSYRQKIYDKVSDIQRRAAGSGHTSYIDISEECLERMKQDPEYEFWVLNKISRNLLGASFHGYEIFTCMKFGAEREDYRCDSISTPTREERRRLQERYRKQKEERKKKLKKLQQKKMLLEQWQRQVYQTELVKLEHIDNRQRIREEVKAKAQGERYIHPDNSCAIRAAARRKAQAYETSFLTANVK